MSQEATLGSQSPLFPIAKLQKLVLFLFLPQFLLLSLPLLLILGFFGLFLAAGKVTNAIFLSAFSSCKMTQICEGEALNQTSMSTRR